MKLSFCIHPLTWSFNVWVLNCYCEFSIDLGWEHTPFETISRKWWYASFGPVVWFGEVQIETIRRIGSILWTIWDAVIISVQEIFSFNVLHFARSYQLKSPVIITRFPSISQVFLPIVPTRRPGWQLASGCCYCYYTPDNDSTHTHTLLAAQKSRLFLWVLARTTHFPASGKSSRSRLLAAHRTGWDLWRGRLRELHLAVEQLGRVHKLPPRVAIFRKFFAPHF